MDEILKTLAEGTDGPLHSLVWMAQDNHMHLPPIPGAYLERLQEVSMMSCFATNRDLVPLLNSSDLGLALDERKWPNTGMALRLFVHGRWIYWQYLLVGRVNLVQVNLRVLLTDDTSVHRLSLVSSANAYLQRHLQDEVVIARYLADGTREPSEIAHIVRYDNNGGALPMETHYTFSDEAGLSAGRVEKSVFGTLTVRKTSQEEMIFRP